MQRRQRQPPVPIRLVTNKQGGSKFTAKNSVPAKPKCYSGRCWPSLSSIISGRPLPSHTACNFEFKPPLVRPIRLGTAPFLEDWRRCDVPSDGSHRSSTVEACQPCALAPRKFC